MRNGNENIMRKQDNPVPYPMTMHRKAREYDTSTFAGLTKPAQFYHLMPNDQASGLARVVIEQEEMEKMIGNAVHLRAHAFFVSYCALGRFNESMDAVMASWAQKAGSANIVDTITFADATHGEFFQALGEHVKEGSEINGDYARAYNAVINYRRALVSKSLTVRTENDHSIARSLWGNTALARVVPDFDAAMMDAAVPLVFTGAELPVEGLILTGNNISSSTNDIDGTVTTAGTSGDHKSVGARTSGTDFGADLVEPIIARLSGTAGQITLNQLKTAENMKKLAQMRAEMAGIDEDLIDLLMRGFSIPSAAYNDPILIDSADVLINQSPRYATDAANLDQYVANGVGSATLNLAMPKQTTGGFIVITYEVIPEPVFDRQADMFLHATFDELPNALRDYLDEQPVAVVPNKFVDALHTTDDGTFGYAPMNYWVAQKRLGAGGRFYRDSAALNTDEDQLHVWSVRETDPVLDEDTFLVPTDLDHYVFQDSTVEPFFARVSSYVDVTGITQFGPVLYESTGDYEAIASVVPTDRIIPPSEA